MSRKLRVPSHIAHASSLETGDSLHVVTLSALKSDRVYAHENVRWLRAQLMRELGADLCTLVLYLSTHNWTSDLDNLIIDKEYYVDVDLTGAHLERILEYGSVSEDKVHKNSDDPAIYTSMNVRTLWQGIPPTGKTITH